MASLTLYAPEGSAAAIRATIVARMNGITLATPAFVEGRDDTTAAFRAKSPLGKAPVLETPAGCVFEANAIARYLARVRRDTELCGRTFFDSAQVDSWMDFAAAEVELPASLWVYPVLGLLEHSAPVAAKAEADLLRALGVLERHLVSRTFLVGETLTLADVTVSTALLYAFKLVLDAKARTPFPAVVRWFLTVVNAPACRAVLGEVALADKVHGPKGAAAAAAPAAKKEKAAPAAAAAAPAAPAAAAAPAAKKEKAKKKKDDDDDDDGEDEMAAFAEPKKVDPFAALPPTTLVLDEWKRTYSNSKVDYYAVMPWFWEHLDTKGWTVWFQKYKYNDENKVDWQTSNLVSGFLQRCDEVRKYSFGGMAVLGTSAPFEVCGAWVLRGDSIAPLLECNPDAEYYDWVKMDVTNDAQRKLVADQWCASEVLDGKTIYDSKIFK